MAQPQSLMKLLECQICTEIFNETDRKPKVMPCQHTVCLHCMKQWARKRGASYGDLLSMHLVIKCPTCTAEHDVPESDVDKFPNNITMISFLSIAPADEDDSSTRPTSQRNDGDIKQCLEDRVQRLRDKIAEAQVSYIKKLSSWDAQIVDAKKIIGTYCAEFKQAIDRREEALVKQVDEFSARRQTSYEGANADFSHELMEMSSFCDRVEQQLKGASQRQTTRNLDRCLEMLETLESTDDSDHGATNGAKWMAKFNPDRKDTVYSSIAMFGQLILQDPGSTPKKKPVAFGNQQCSKSDGNTPVDLAPLTLTPEVPNMPPTCKKVLKKIPAEISIEPEQEQAMKLDPSVVRVVLSMDVSMIRLGSWTPTVIKPIVFQSNCIMFSFNGSPAARDKCSQLRLDAKDITLCQYNLKKGMPTLFLYTTPKFAMVARRRLKIVKGRGPFFDPGSEAESEKRVIIRPLSDPDHNHTSKILEAFDGMAACTKRRKSALLEELDEEAVHRLLEVVAC
ncbi:uncharacterized protein [Amphiura filiformis]|uniref:uncharacterized protein n=1 Tax=Amphiura filiformis TaxID=82378 RepID=UPI003B21D695